MHTPGPWIVDKNIDKRLWLSVRGGEKRHNAELPPSICRLSRIQTLAQAEANARLIAAAPALLEALERMLKTHDPFDTTDEMEDARQEARAALAAARGEGVTA